MKNIRYLLHHPIGVCMITLALCILGFVGYKLLPVSLLPDIPIPEIYVKISSHGRAAGDVEKLAVSPIRQQLLTIEGLTDISSKTTDNQGVIELRFSFDTDINTALANVSDIVFKASSNLPSDFDSPKIIKSRASDIPVEYINMTLKEEIPFSETDPEKFVNMSEVAENVVARRIEQLPEVAMVDIGGSLGKEITLLPNKSLLQESGISENDISEAISSNVVAPMNVRVKDGVYEYSVFLENSLVSIDDISNVSFRKNGRIFHVGDVCEVNESFLKDNGFSIHQGKRSVTMRVIKKQESKMDDLKKDLSKSLKYFSAKYPDIEFSVSRDQTEMLDYSISTLKENFIMSVILMFIVAFMFMGDFLTPVVTAVSMSAALIIGFLVFYIFHVSVNILSLSGLILVVGMMIDNILITSENIMQHQERGEDLITSISAGTAEMGFPMLSSTLTTIVVFIPLIFMSDMAGALFLDQSLAVGIGLMTSYFVALLLLPVLFMICAKIGILQKQSKFQQRVSNGITRLMTNFYDKGADMMFRYRKPIVILVILSIPSCYLLYRILPKSMLPQTETSEMIMKIEWEPGLSTDENGKRISDLLKDIKPMAVEISASIGDPGFLSEGKSTLSSHQAEIYLKAASPDSLDKCRTTLTEQISRLSPDALISTTSGENIFDKIFVNKKAPVIVKIYDDGSLTTQNFQHELNNIIDTIKTNCGVKASMPRMQEEILIIPNREAMEFHNVAFDAISKEIKNAFGDKEVTRINSSSNAPVVFRSGFNDWSNYFRNATVSSSTGRVPIPLPYLVDYRYRTGFSEIIGDHSGIHYPIDIFPDNNPEQTADRIEETLHTHFPNIKSEVDGLIMDEKESFGGLFWILILSILLIYFILCAQFESFVQPIVLLSEIPIDVCAAFLALWIFGYTFNIMSAIGIIASCGIIVNDSILKIDAINHLLKSGMHIQEAIHVAGRQRIRPIVMTTLTSVIAMLPFFFNNDLGSGLQQPLALGMIAALSVGTLVSLFIIPLLFEVLVTKSKKIDN